MKKYIFLVFIGISFGSLAQQDPIFSQYAFNPLVINPAYAGSRNSFSTVLLHRSQWVGIDGAPTTQTFSFHSPLNKSNLALGFTYINDKLGPTRNSTAALSVAYHLKFRKSKLAFGLRAGLFSATYDFNMLNFKEANDNYDVGGAIRRTIPSFDFGVYYYKAKFYAGISATHMNSTEMNFFDFGNDGGNFSYYLHTHIFLTSGYVFELNDKVIFKPSILLKFVHATLPNTDLAFNFMFYKKFWLGLSFRNRSSVNFLTEWNITDYLRMGYAYDFNINQLNTYSRGSHELFLGFDFNIKSKKNVSPRYL